MVISFDEKLKIQSEFMIFDGVFSQEVGDCPVFFPDHVLQVLLCIKN